MKIRGTRKWSKIHAQPRIIGDIKVFDLHFTKSLYLEHQSFFEACGLTVILRPLGALDVNIVYEVRACVDSLDIETARMILRYFQTVGEVGF